MEVPPIAGWFMFRKILWTWMMTGAFAHLWFMMRDFTSENLGENVIMWHHSVKWWLIGDYRCLYYLTGEYPGLSYLWSIYSRTIVMNQAVSYNGMFGLFGLAHLPRRAIIQDLQLIFTGWFMIHSDETPPVRPNFDAVQIDKFMFTFLPPAEMISFYSGLRDTKIPVICRIIVADHGVATAVIEIRDHPLPDSSGWFWWRTQFWLVVNGCHQFGIFPLILGWNVIIPTDELIFFRGVAQPPTRFVKQTNMMFFMFQKWGESSKSFEFVWPLEYWNKHGLDSKNSPWLKKASSLCMSSEEGLFLIRFDHFYV